MKKTLETCVWIVVIGVFIFIGYMGMTWGGRSSGDNQFKYDLEKLRQVPQGMISHRQTGSIKITGGSLKAVAVSDNDTIYVGAGKQVVKYDSKGKEVDRCELKYDVQALAVVSDDKVYVAGISQVVVLDADLEVTDTWKDFGSRAVITSVAVGDEYIYIADAGNKVAYICNKQGEVTGRAGRKSVEKNSPGLIIPSPFCDVVAESDGTFWLINTGHHSFENYSNDGYLVKSWQKKTNKLEGFTGCCNPSHVARMPDGSFVTAEKGIERVKLYSNSGKLMSVVAAPDSFAENTKGLDLAVDSKNRILIADPVRNELRIFEKASALQ